MSNFKKNDLVRIRRSDGTFQIAKVNKSVGNQVFVQWNELNLKFGKIIDSRSITLFERHNSSWHIFQWVFRLFVQVFTIKNILLCSFVSLFLNGLYTNYCNLKMAELEILEKKQSWFQYLYPSSVKPTSLYEVSVDLYKCKCI